MKKIIIAILGIAALPFLVFAQSSPFGIAVDQFSSPRYRGGAPATVPSSRPANTVLTPTIPPKAPKPRPITGITKMVLCEPASYEDKDAPTKPEKPVTYKDENGNVVEFYYKCKDAQGNTVYALSDEAIRAIEKALDAKGTLEVFFDPAGNAVTGGPMMRTAPIGTVPSPIVKPASTKPPKPHVGPTDLPPLKPIPDTEPDKVALPFRFVPVNPPATAPVKPPKPAVVSNEGDDADLDAMKAALSALIGPLQARIEKLKKDGATDAEIKPLQKQLDDLKKIVSGK